ncbi:MAG TPA: hypothetical protein DER18_01570 [Shewanella baltica]|nr:hypothetical protein [Shewanella baltica]
MEVQDTNNNKITAENNQGEKILRIFQYSVTYIFGIDYAIAKSFPFEACINSASHLIQISYINVNFSTFNV